MAPRNAVYHNFFYFFFNAEKELLFFFAVLMIDDLSWKDTHLLLLYGSFSSFWLCPQSTLMVSTAMSALDLTLTHTSNVSVAYALVTYT